MHLKLKLPNEKEVEHFSLVLSIDHLVLTFICVPSLDEGICYKVFLIHSYMFILENEPNMGCF